jgi:hypothetical protein
MALPPSDHWFQRPVFDVDVVAGAAALQQHVGLILTLNIPESAHFSPFDVAFPPLALKRHIKISEAHLKLSEPVYASIFEIATGSLKRPWIQSHEFSHNSFTELRSVRFMRLLSSGPSPLIYRKNKNPLRKETGGESFC